MSTDETPEIPEPNRVYVRPFDSSIGTEIESHLWMTALDCTRDGATLRGPEVSTKSDDNTGISNGDNRGVQLYQVFCDSENKAPDGLLSLLRLASDPNQVQLGFRFRQATYESRGALVFECLRTFIKRLFFLENIQRIICYSSTEQKEVHALLQSLGMVCEATLRKNHLYADEWCDEFVYAMLKQDLGEKDSRLF